MKKILVVNKYHFISGGAERYFLSVMEALEKRGIETIPLAIRYAKTLPTPYKRYFPEPVVDGGEHKIRNQSPSVAERFQIAAEAVYNRRVKAAARRIIQDHRPDVAYLLNINNHISPSVIDACRDENVPVVMRLSDFNLVCASNMYFRNGRPCMDCKGGFHHALIHRCVHGSLAKTAVSVFANSFHRWSGIYRNVDAFVAPSHFMRQELVELGFHPSIVHQVNTFVEAQEMMEPDADEPYILYLGRFVDYKGPDAALEAFARVRKPGIVRLCLMGDENDADARRLKELTLRLGVKNVDFLPFERDKKKLLRIAQRSLFTLAPSKFYENLPHSILESFACGRPVIATRLGSIPEVVKEGVNGLLFEPGNLDEFARHIETLLNDTPLCRRMGEAAHKAAREEYSVDAHLNKLLGIFSGVSQGEAATC